MLSFGKSDKVSGKLSIAYERASWFIAANVTSPVQTISALFERIPALSASDWQKRDQARRELIKAGEEPTQIALREKRAAEAAAKGPAQKIA